jgi:membrane protein DedA with SNARE-associated domain
MWVKEWQGGCWHAILKGIPGMFEYWLLRIGDLGTWAYLLLFGFALAESLAVVGLLVPGATFVVLFGFLAAQGIFDFERAVCAAAFGAMIGDVLSFILGRRGIDPARRFPRLFSQASVERAEVFMINYGVAGVLLGRFIGPLRPFVPFMAGALKMRWRSFMAMNVVSGMLWAASYLSIGYFFGQFWSSINRGIQWVGVGMAVIIMGYLALRGLGERRRRRKVKAKNQALERDNKIQKQNEPAEDSGSER